MLKGREASIERRGFKNPPPTLILVMLIVNTYTLHCSLSVNVLSLLLFIPSN